MEVVKERKSMHRNWLDRAPWRPKQDALNASAVENGEAHGKGNSNGKNHKENLMSHSTPPSEKAMPFARAVPDFQVELLPMEDIYRAAGIMNPRKGYSIIKVVEMLHSQHIRGLSQEMKRAAVLMALDAAGISLDQLQRDAQARQEALDSHEADQRKQVEAEWARKAEEVIQIQAELESIKAHYTARVSRNLEGVAKEKATFNAWLAMKQQETQNMSEAVNLCLKAPAPEPTSAPVAEVSLARAASAGVQQESRSDAIH
jgi:lambda repressor-like predicted transcriptional regulator